MKKRISFGDTHTLSLTKQISRIRYITLNEINLILRVFPVHTGDQWSDGKGAVTFLSCFDTEYIMDYAF